MTLYLAKRWCSHGSHDAPAKDFRVLPGGTIKRWVCERCYQRIMEKREEKKREGWTA